MTSAIGFIAGLLTTAAWIPQLIKIMRSRHADDVSWLMLVLLGVGMSLWLLYGILIVALPVIIPNAVSLLLQLAIIVVKLRVSEPSVEFLLAEENDIAVVRVDSLS